MNETASGLRELHGIHTQIHRIKTELDRGPRQVRAKRRALDTKQAEIEAHKKKLLQARKSADEKSLQLKTNESKLRDLQVKLNQATSNREFEAIKGQMNADQVANSVLEDEILEALEKVDSLQAAIAQCEQEATELEKTCDEFAQKITQNEAGLKSELSLLEKALVDAERVIPASLKDDYRRLVNAHGDSSLAPIENMACSQCMSRVTAQQGIDLRTGKFTFCRSCGRLLYQIDS